MRIARILMVGGLLLAGQAQAATLLKTVSSTGVSTTHVSATGNISAARFLGDGSALTGVSGAATTSASTFTTTGNPNGFSVYDRAGGTGHSVFYRTNNVTRLYDNVAGDVISYSSSGTVGIGTSPGSTNLLDVGISNSSVRMGNAYIGNWPGTTAANGGMYAFFGNSALNHTGGGNYALLQQNNGNTFLNAAGGMSLLLRVSNTDVAQVKNTGISLSAGMTLQVPGALSTYGGVTFDGSKNSYNGINFRSGGTNFKTFMVNGTYSGMYNSTDSGWDWYWTNGTLSQGVIPAANVAAGMFSGGSVQLTGNALYRPYGFNGPEYDGNDGTYYADPNATSYFNDMRINVIYQAANTGYYLQPGSNNRLNTIIVDTYCDGSSNCVNGYGVYWVVATYYSDARLKENVRDLGTESGLAKIMQLRPVRFDWKDVKQSKEMGPQIGLVAQEVKKVFPEVVHATAGSPTTITLANGKKEQVNNPEMVDYNKLVAPLIEAVQQLKKENDAMRGQMDAHKADFEAYKKAHP